MDRYTVSPLPRSPLAASLPSDIELSNMLRNRVHSNSAMQLPSSIIIHEADVYAADPADLTERFAPVVAQNGKKVWYFVTELLPKNPQGKRKNRCTGSGVWHDEGKSKPVTELSSRSQIASRKFFSYQRKGLDGKKVRPGWHMREYQLQGGNSMVLCMIYTESSGRRAADNEVAAPAPAGLEPAMLEVAPQATVPEEVAPPEPATENGLLDLDEELLALINNPSDLGYEFSDMWP